MSVKNTKVNKSFRRRANFFVFSPEHIIPFGLSLFFGFIVVGVWFQAGFIWVMVYTCAPFITWLIVAGQSPARTAAKYQHPPRWRRGRGRHSVWLKRKPTPAISQQILRQEKLR
ncbi:hypothetical protein NIES970_29890 (plasmid) [[Synechococcus] sp. NIES-970]|nr:hypothetical protein NIES970_29890 [[Synechococcus] sp. NIES-970]